MYKALNETSGLEENKAQVNTIENRLANLIEAFKSSPTSESKTIRNRNNMLDVIELILEFNQLNQSGQGLKILTPSHMLGRLPVFFCSIKCGK